MTSRVYEKDKAFSVDPVYIGRAAREITFQAMRISWVAFAVDSVSSDLRNARLAEFAVFKG
jgi:hypothetical protein